MSDKKLDWMAKQVLDTFTYLGFNADYMENLHHTLNGKSRAEVLAWCSNLDLRCKRAVADKLNIDIHILSIGDNTQKQLDEEAAKRRELKALITR